MISADAVNHLRGLYEWLGQTPAETLGEVAREARPIEAPAGALLFELGGRPPGSFLFCQGAARVMRPAPGGRIVFLYRVRPGELCAMSLLALETNSTYLATATAETDARVVVIPAALHRQLANVNRAFREAIARTITTRVATLLRSLEEMTLLKTDQRLVLLLASRGPRITATHQELADELNSTRETVSRLLGKLEREGLVRLSRGHIDVLDAGLQELRRDVDGSLEA